MRALPLLLLLLRSAPARANVIDSAPAAAAYAAPTLLSGMAVVGDGVHLLYDEPTPAFWRGLGWGAGGVSVALGVYLIGWGDAASLGGVSLGVGATAVLLATLAPSPERPGRVALAPQLVPWVGGGVAGAVLSLPLE